MKNVNTKYFATGMAIMPLALLAVAVAIAGNVATPNTFTAGTTAVAAEVNANFAAHAAEINDNDTRITANTTALAGMPQVWAQRDMDGGGSGVVASGHLEMNSVSINAPANGFLLICGTVFINNNEATDERYTIVPKVDGADVLSTPWAALTGLGPNGSNEESDTLTYAITVPITAGAHTISHTAGPFSGTASFFHNAEGIDVVFIATGTITTQNSP